MDNDDCDGRSSKEKGYTCNGNGYSKGLGEGYCSESAGESSSKRDGEGCGAGCGKSHSDGNGFVRELLIGNEGEGTGAIDNIQGARHRCLRMCSAHLRS